MENEMTDTTNPVLTFGQKLEAFAEKEKAAVVALAGKFLPEIEQGLETVVQDVEVALEDIAGLVFQSVLAEAPKLISGEEKFGNAVDNVVQTVEAGGKTIFQTTAQMAVQQAYLTAQNIAAASKGGS